MSHVIKVPLDAQKLLAQLVSAKSKAASSGDFWAVRNIDLQIRLFRLKYGLVGKGKNTTKIVPPKAVQDMASKRRNAEAMALAKLKIPAWFRPGYRDIVRVRLWRRLSATYRAYLARLHAQGQLAVYKPAKAYFAKKYPVSVFLSPPVASPVDISQMTEVVTVVAENPDGSASTEQKAAGDLVVDTLEASTEIMALANELAAEADDEATLDASLEPAGEGMMADEENWYNDPTKLALAGVGALVLISALRG